MCDCKKEKKCKREKKCKYQKKCCRVKKCKTVVYVKCCEPCVYYTYWC